MNIGFAALKISLGDMVAWSNIEKLRRAEMLKRLCRILIVPSEKDSASLFSVKKINLQKPFFKKINGSEEIKILRAAFFWIKRVSTVIPP